MCCSVVRYLFPMQLGGFKAPFITVAGAIFIFIPIVIVLMKPTSECKGLYCIERLFILGVFGSKR